ncbi:MAG TPA: class E sortase [Actinomycetota bacterium]
MAREEQEPLYPSTVLSSDREVSGVRSAGWLILDAWRRRPVPRRVLGTISVFLLLGGLTLVFYPQLTNLYGDWRQSRLEASFIEPETTEAYAARAVLPGEALTKVEIPRLGLESIVVEGTSPGALRAGAGHYEGTALPCEVGNAAMAGHRTTYSKPFADLHRLRPGDAIVLVTPVGRCVYEVAGSWVTTPDDVSVLADIRGASMLTLTTCHPPGSARERLIVRAELVSSEAA